MSEPLNEAYFNWLCSKVMYDEKGRTLDLMRCLHRYEFTWVLPGDSNRADDGVDLRHRFILETRLSDNEWDPLGCSVLEMLIALAYRLEFQMDTPAKGWFWKMLENLNLADYRHVMDADLPVIDDILYNFVWRQYDDRGAGGLWPLNHQREDQRQVEIWYQFFAYLEDRGLM